MIPSPATGGSDAVVPFGDVLHARRRTAPPFFNYVFRFSPGCGMLYVDLLRHSRITLVGPPTYGHVVGGRRVLTTGVPGGDHGVYHLAVDRYCGRRFAGRRVTPALVSPECQRFVSRGCFWWADRWSHRRWRAAHAGWGCHSGKHPGGHSRRAAFLLGRARPRLGHRSLSR